VSSIDPIRPTAPAASPWRVPPSRRDERQEEEPHPRHQQAEEGDAADDEDDGENVHVDVTA